MDDAEDGAIRSTLNTSFAREELGLLPSSRNGWAVGGVVRRTGDVFFDTAGGVIYLCSEAETFVVLSEGERLIPIIKRLVLGICTRMKIFDIRAVGKYQFAATIGFPSTLTRLDFGFRLTFGFDERFFFF
jgi:hypothetical protein